MRGKAGADGMAWNKSSGRRDPRPSIESEVWDMTSNGTAPLAGAGNGYSTSRSRPQTFRSTFCSLPLLKPWSAAELVCRVTGNSLNLVHGAR